VPRKPKTARAAKRPRKTPAGRYPTYDDLFRPEDAVVREGPDVLQPSKLAYRDDTRGLWLYHGDCLEVMDHLLERHPHGVFDLIFADPPYFLSNGGITCHAGKMVKVDKGAWDKSRGPALNHEFNTEWLRRCQALLKPNGTLWVSGTHHVIFSVGYAMQQLGMKLLNQVTWQKPNPPPNLACRYFTHSTETLLWTAKNEKSRHVFHYDDMKRANGNKQMKDVWTLTAPKPDEKALGKHPTQKPVALLERILLAASNPGDLVLDPFMGSGTTAVVSVRLNRQFVGLDADINWVELATRRLRGGGGLSLMPMVMPYEDAWRKLVAERVDTTRDLVVITKRDIEETTGNELRLMAKMDSLADVPAALKEHGYFILPIKNGEYALVRESGYHQLESLPAPPSVFRPSLDFELLTLGVGDAEMQHLDYCFNTGLFEHFGATTGLRQTIRGRKRMPSVSFSVGEIGPINVRAGVQVEVDSGCEGRSEVILIEAKSGETKDFIIRQVYYPYLKWRREIPTKQTRNWFFCSRMIADRRLYEFWEYAFEDDAQYRSIRFKRGESFFVEALQSRMSVDELLRGHFARFRGTDQWDVPQADDFARVAEMPLLIAQGINNSKAVAKHYRFDRRQSSYYRQAAEYLGLVTTNADHQYELTDLGSEYVSRTADERRKILAGLVANFPPMKAVLEMSSNGRLFAKEDVARIIERHSSIRGSTPGRRVATLISWLGWLESATGAVEQESGRFRAN